ncbi:thermonuclease family protein [Sphingomonas sp. ASV193]|uniref:thermonuclease family protein n=1 Tax=Sphingomonas sp. ASV193 TaxID=3144405 RepID=UPI0032E9163E
MDHRNWNDGRDRNDGRWMTPADYDSLSGEEKRALWLARKAKRQRRRGWAGAATGLAIAAAGIGAYTLTPTRHPAPAPGAEASAASDAGTRASPGPSAGERGDFGSCEWGGRTDCVVDGDTFYWHGEKIRIAGIDAPETHDLYKCRSELALGEKAAARLRDLLNSGPLVLTPIDRDRDVYGRLLRNVAVNGTDVGEVLVQEGLAHEYRGYKEGWC